MAEIQTVASHSTARRDVQKISTQKIQMQQFKENIKLYKLKKIVLLLSDEFIIYVIMIYFMLPFSLTCNSTS